VSTAEDIVPRTRLSRDSPSETSSINHLKKILKKTELSNSTSSPNCTSKCSTVSVAPFTPELSKSDQLPTEKSELPQQEFKEMLQEKFKEVTNDCHLQLILIKSHIFKTIQSFLNKKTNYQTKFSF